MSCKDPSIAYENFFQQYNDIYEINFPLIKQSRRAYKDKKWITTGLKISSKRKNALYKKWLATRSPTDNKIYKQYKAIFSRLSKQAETFYYKSLFDKCSKNQWRFYTRARGT